MDDREIRELVSEIVAENQRINDVEIKCIKEDIEKSAVAIRGELCHKHDDVKEQIENEIENRKEAIKYTHESIEHKSDLTKWLISGAFVAMASMGGVLYNLIISGDAQAISELCQQGSFLIEVTTADANIVIGYINQALGGGERFELIKSPSLANCYLGS